MRVSPGMLETKVMMAPNSPRLAANAVISAGDDAGQRERQGDIEQPVEASPRPASRRFVQALVGALERQADGADLEGKGDDAEASAAPVQLKTKRMPKCASSQAPRPPRVPKSDQQQKADRHRRQHQRQMDEPVDHDLAREIACARAAARQQRRTAVPRTRRPTAMRRLSSSAWLSGRVGAAVITGVE